LSNQLAAHEREFMSAGDSPIIHTLNELDDSGLIRTIIDAVPDPIFCKDLDRRYLLTNRAHSVVFGCEPGQVLGKTSFDVPGICENAAAYNVDDENVLQTGEPVINREEPFQRADGTKGWFLTSKFPLRDGQGNIMGLIGIARDISQRREAERKLREERQMLKTLIDAIPDPLFFKDRSGKHLLYNRAIAELFGLNEQNYIGKTVFELPIPREHAEESQRDDERVLITGEPVVNREEPYVRRDKGSGWFLTSKFPLRDAEGQITGLVGICRDITARRDAERKLSEERKFLQTLIDAIPDLIFLKDREGRHLHINAADRRKFGVTDEHVGKTVYEWPIPPEHAEMYAKDDRYVFETGNSIINREEPFVRPDGSQGWLLTSKQPMRNEAGEIVGLVGIARDVTELKQEREELEGARQRLVDHVENSPLAIIEWLPDLRVQRWGGRSKDIFGWEPSEVEGKHFFDWPFVHLDDASSFEATVGRLLRGEERRNVSRTRNLTKSGELVHCVWHNSVLRDSDDRIVSVFSLVQNITEQARAEEQAHRAEKERLAIERKLLEAQKLESLGLLAGGIAHDFNNLLTSVIGNASLAAVDVAPTSSTASCLEQIQLAATRAAELCQQMLAYSGKGRFVVKRVDLNELITETTSLIHASISKTSSLGLSLAPMLPGVLADEAQMRQIIMNLVINASEALSDRSGAIRVSTGVMRVNRSWLLRAHLAPDLPEDDYVFLEVLDTGCGMSAEVRSRIFDPFFTTKFTGRGLGLAAVLGIVRGHGGALRVESESDRGTTIRVVFPKAVGDLEDIPGSMEPSQRWRGSGTVLVVDDEEAVRQVTRRMLRSLGFEVELAVDGLDGVHQFEALGDRLRLVLLDLTMPRMDGEAAFREFQRIKVDVPIILMSGFNEQEVVSHFGVSGLAGFLQKPFTLGMVEARLRDVLG
jgi:two-component system, cell cycle sensor histidine kinase and response regulator CckA